MSTKPEEAQSLLDWLRTTIAELEEMEQEEA